MRQRQVWHRLHHLPVGRLCLGHLFERIPVSSLPLIFAGLAEFPEDYRKFVTLLRRAVSFRVGSTDVSFALLRSASRD